MKTRALLHAIVVFFISILLIGAINAQTRGKSRAPEFQRFSLSLGGGMSSLEEHRHLLNLGAEVQVALANRVRLGLGVGYLNNMHGGRGSMDDRYSNERNDRMSGWMTLFGNGKNSFEGSGSNTTIRVIPVTLNVYYFVPVGRKWNVYAAAGASYNFGSFREGTLSQHKGAFGGQAGLGIEFRLANRLRLIGEGSYRFVEFHALRHPESTTNLWAELLGLGTDSRTLTGWEKLISEFLDQALGRSAKTEESHYNLNLNGFTCRLGVKFGF